MAAPKPAGGWKHDRRSRHERGYDSRWVRLRKLVIARDKGLCQACLRQGYVSEGTECDHILPRAKGGEDELSNLQMLCKDCHKAKTARDDRETQRMERRDGWRP